MGEEERLGQPTQDTERGAEDKGIAHQGAAIGLGMEFVHMGDLLEDTLYHFVYEARWPLIGGDLRGQVLLDPEVYRLPGYDVAQLHQARRHAGDGSFLRMAHGAAMGIDTDREVEAAL